jgi:hypothetical protein
MLGIPWERPAVMPRRPVASDGSYPDDIAGEAGTTPDSHMLVVAGPVARVSDRCDVSEIRQ